MWQKITEEKSLEYHKGIGLFVINIFYEVFFNVFELKGFTLMIPNRNQIEIRYYQ